MSNYIKRSFIHLISRSRTLRTSILVLFLSLFIFSFACVISFKYSKNYKAIIELSRTLAHEKIATIDSKFETIALASERFTTITADFFQYLHPLELNNPLFGPYLISVAKNDPNYSNC